MYQINCNSVDPNSGDAFPVSFSFIDGVSEEGIEISFDCNEEGKECLYFGVDELYLIVETLKKERDNRRITDV